MPSGLEFVVLILATHRLSNLWFEEIATPLRRRLAAHAGRLGYLAQCPLCISIWASATVVGLWAVPGGRWVCLGLALSTSTLLLTQVMGWIGAISPMAQAQQRLMQQQHQQRPANGREIVRPG